MFLTSTGEKYPHNVLCDFLGWNDGAKLNFDTCDFPTVFSNISPEQLAGLKGEYQCGCKVCIIYIFFIVRILNRSKVAFTNTIKVEENN